MPPEGDQQKVRSRRQSDPYLLLSSYFVEVPTTAAGFLKLALGGSHTFGDPLELLSGGMEQLQSCIRSPEAHIQTLHRQKMSHPT